MQDRIDRLGPKAWAAMAVKGASRRVAGFTPSQPSQPRLLAVQAINAVLHLPPISISSARPPSVKAIEGRRCYRFSRCPDPFRLAEAAAWEPREGSNRPHAVSASLWKL